MDHSAVAARFASRGDPGTRKRDGDRSRLEIEVHAEEEAADVQKGPERPQHRSTQGHTAQATPASETGGSQLRRIGGHRAVDYRQGRCVGRRRSRDPGTGQGTVNLAQHNVTVGPSGRVKADVRGKMVIVEGEVEGDLKAQEQIVLRHTARVEGSISAPRVALEDGAVFRGGIEMDSTAKTGSRKAHRPRERQPAATAAKRPPRRKPRQRMCRRRAHPSRTFRPESSFRRG